MDRTDTMVVVRSFRLSLRGIDSALPFLWARVNLRADLGARAVVLVFGVWRRYLFVWTSTEACMYL